jgi:hypothetical protein
MQSVYLSEREKQDNFAKMAARYFNLNKEKTSFTEGEIERGCFFALRYGCDGNGVVVFKIDDFVSPTNYIDICKEVSM